MRTIEKVKTLTDKECIVDFLYKEVCSHPCASCGKCVFGYEGITQLQLILKDIISKKAQPEDYRLLHDLSDLMISQSLCDDGKEIGEAVRFSLERYREDFELHIARKACPAEVCSRFLTFHILASKCTGCNDCMSVCEDGAILGKPKFIHVIELDDCMQCGKCLNVCDQQAIVTAGLKKPKGPRKPIPVKK